MKDKPFSLFSNFGQKLVIVLLIGTTAFTSGSVVSKLKTENVLNNSDETVRQSESDNSISEALITATVTPTAEETPTPKITTIPKANKVIPTAVKIPSPTQSLNNTNKCIITVSGQLYDITTLRNSHSGGDIFKCDTDMTSVYRSKHGTSLSRISGYIYNPNSPTSPQPTNTNDDDNEDEKDDD